MFRRRNRCLIFPSTVLMLVILFTIFVTSASPEPFSSPRSCIFNRRTRVVNVEDCKFGWEVDACGNKICAKGPGEVCGGKHMRYGICGEGLMCSNCNRCQGCSMRTYQCFDDSKCIHY